MLYVHGGHLTLLTHRYLACAQKKLTDSTYSKRDEMQKLNTNKQPENVSQLSMLITISLCWE